MVRRARYMSFQGGSSLGEAVADRRKGLLWRVFSKQSYCLYVKEVMQCLSLSAAWLPDVKGGVEGWYVDEGLAPYKV